MIQFNLENWIFSSWMIAIRNQKINNGESKMEEKIVYSKLANWISDYKK